jgi:hypothetical protein
MLAKSVAAIFATAALMGAAPQLTAPTPIALQGTWTMSSAYEIHTDGRRTTNYGEHPSGLMMVDSDGRYSIQIFRPARPNFASGIKAKGLPEEYRDAVLGSSTHFGRVRVDPAAHQLLFDVEASSFPNWEGKRQVRNYTYADGVLTYCRAGQRCR